MTGSNTEGGGIAKVTFRVRCETLGHGEAIFLYPDDETIRVSTKFAFALNESLFALSALSFQ
jgi:hypothetical protein